MAFGKLYGSKSYQGIIYLFNKLTIETLEKSWNYVQS